MRNRGFTVVEMLVVLAIIAVLVAIALPIYANYILRAQVGRVSAEVGSLRTAWEACMLEGRVTPATCDFGATGSNLLVPGSGNTYDGGPPASGGAPVATMSPDGSGKLTATFGGNAAPVLAAAAASLSRIRDAQGNWTCKTVDVPINAIPVGCTQG